MGQLPTLVPGRGAALHRDIAQLLSHAPAQRWTVIQYKRYKRLSFQPLSPPPPTPLHTFVALPTWNDSVCDSVTAKSDVTHASGPCASGPPPTSARAITAVSAPGSARALSLVGGWWVGGGGVAGRGGALGAAGEGRGWSVGWYRVRTHGRAGQGQEARACVHHPPAPTPRACAHTQTPYERAHTSSTSSTPTWGRHIQCVQVHHAIGHANRHNRAGCGS